MEVRHRGPRKSTLPDWGKREGVRQGVETTHQISISLLSLGLLGTFDFLGFSYFIDEYLFYSD